MPLLGTFAAGSIRGFGGLISAAGGGAPTTIFEMFTSTTNWTAPTGVTEIEYLVVGGGAGGACLGGGGGAGGFRTGSGFAVTPGTTYTVTVGGGGAAGLIYPAAGNAYVSIEFADAVGAEPPDHLGVIVVPSICKFATLKADELFVTENAIVIV